MSSDWCALHCVFEFSSVRGVGMYFHAINALHFQQKQEK